MKVIDISRRRFGQFILFLGFFLFIQHTLFAQFHINGSAEFDTAGECISFSPSYPMDFASVWNSEEISLENSFRIEFILNFGCDPSSGSEGIVFGLLPNWAPISSFGDGLGYEGLSPSLGIEFDTHNDGAENNDPSQDHVALLRDGNLDHNFDLAGPFVPENGNFEDCQDHEVVVHWKADTQEFKVLYDCNLVFNYTGDLVNSIFSGNPWVKWGFTSSTETTFGNQSLCIIQNTLDTPIENQFICDTDDSAQLIAPSGFSNYSWTPTEDISDPNSPTPLASPSETTTYNLVATDDCGETYEKSLTVYVNYLPGLNWQPITSLCLGESKVLDAYHPDALSYEWFNGNTSSSFFITEPGEYWVLVDLGYCTKMANTTVYYVDPDDLNLGFDYSLCEWQGTVLNANIAGAFNYIWQDGSTNPIYEVTEPGTYKVDVMTDGCAFSDEITISVSDILELNMGDNAILCANDTLFLNATIPGATYQWMDGSTEAIYPVTTPGAYFVTVEVNGCIGYDAIAVVYNDIPQVELGPDVTLCPGEEVVLDAQTPDATYFWNTGHTSPNLVVEQAGYYSVKIEINGCTSFDDIWVEAAPVELLEMGGTYDFCPGESVLVDASNPDLSNFNWSDGEVSSSRSFSEEGEFTLSATYNNCPVEFNYTISEASFPDLVLESEVSFCDGENYLLEITEVDGAIYTWNTGDTESSLSVSEAGIYTVIVEYDGCTKSYESNAETNALPSTDLPVDLLLCPEETYSLDLSESGASSYVWSNGNSSSSFLVETSGLYEVDLITDSGCSTTYSVDVVYLSESDIDLGDPIYKCAGETVVLDASFIAADSFLWEGGETTSNIEIVEAGTYSVLLEINGCSQSAVFEVIEQSLPVAELSSTYSICPGEAVNIELLYSGSGIVEWSNGNSSNSVSVDEAGTYSLVINENGCVLELSTIVEAEVIPVFDLPESLLLCEGDQYQLDASVGSDFTYEWQDGSSNSSFIVVEGGLYQVEVTSLNGCTYQQELVIEYLSQEVISLGELVKICEGDDFILDATYAGASNYLWEDGFVGPIRTVNEAGNYSLSFDLNGCTAFAERQVEVSSPPIISLAPIKEKCSGSSSLLGIENQANQSYLWNTGETTSIIEVLEPGTYILEVFENGCSSFESIELVDMDLPVLDLGEDIDLCRGEHQLLDIGLDLESVISIRWQNESTNTKLDASEEGVYSVEVEHECGTLYDELEVRVDDCGWVCPVLLPTAFSPNGDGTNDNFRPIADCGLLDFELIIFNRYGNKVFESRNPDLPWDGKFKGQNAQLGVYTWVMYYTVDNGANSGPKMEKGNLTLIR